MAGTSPANFAMTSTAQNLNTQTAQLLLLKLAEGGPFRRAQARVGVGSTAYADLALRALIGQGQIQPVTLGGRSFYQQPTETRLSTDTVSLEHVRDHFRAHPMPITGNALGADRAAADELVRRGELQRATVGHCQIYSVPPSILRLPQHQPGSDAEGMTAAKLTRGDLEKNNLGSAALSGPSEFSGPVTAVTIQEGAALVNVLTAGIEHQVRLGTASPVAVGDYLWVRQEGGACPVSSVLLPGHEVTLHFLNTLPGLSAADAQKISAALGAGGQNGLVRQDTPEESIPLRLHAALQVASAAPQRYELGGLMMLGLPLTLAQRLARIPGAAGRHHHNPYLLAPELGFQAADTLARKLGVLPENPNRHAALCAELLRRYTLNGHTFMPCSRLLAQLEDCALSSSEAQAAVQIAQTQGHLLLDDQRVYLPETLRTERELALCLREHTVRPVRVIPMQGGPGVNADQRRAILQASSHALSILTGGPGTGKSTAIRQLCDSVDAAGLRVTLTAPTGKAAARLSEATRREAVTLHRLLGFAQGGFSRNAQRPVQTDVLVLDEASMVGDEQMLHLMRALTTSTKLLLVGDTNQLPPIEHGQPLHALLGRVPTTRLHRVYRQAEGSRILTVAGAVLTGDDFPWADEVQDCKDAADVAGHASGETPMQLLTPTRAGPFGAATLNEAVQAARGLSGGVAIRDGVAHPGDPVMQTVNDYAREVFNGTIGRVVDVSVRLTTVDFDGRTVTYKGSERLSLQPAYAVTIHRAQGSEWPRVGVVLHENHLALLSKALVYTALTRARQHVSLLGNALAWEVAASKLPEQRCTALAERIYADDKTV